MSGVNLYLRGAVLVALAFLYAASGKGDAMSQSNAAPVIWASCAAQSDKTTLPDGLCALFVSQMAQAYPACEIRESTTPPAAGLRVVLVLLRAGPARLEARLDWSGKPGEPRGTMLVGQTLGRARIAEFIEDLIRRSPPPEPCA